MCGLFFGVLSEAGVLEEQRAALALPPDRFARGAIAMPSPSEWEQWEALRSDFPDASHSCAPYHDAQRLVVDWWGQAEARWMSDGYAPLREAWTRLGWLLYGRLFHNVGSGEGWYQTRPRRAPFARRLHPVGTVQWGHTTTAQQQIAAPVAVIEQALPPAMICCCYLGSDLSTDRPDEIALLITVMDTWSLLALTTPPAQWLVIESDTDYNE